jgi:hypothetical protein
VIADLILLDPSNDPEISQAGIDFLYRLLPSHVNILIEQPPAAQQFLFMFALKALRGRDPLPKFAAADFWVRYMNLIICAGANIWAVVLLVPGKLRRRSSEIY